MEGTILKTKFSGFRVKRKTIRNSISRFYMREVEKIVLMLTKPMIMKLEIQKQIMMFLQTTKV